MNIYDNDLEALTWIIAELASKVKTVRQIEILALEMD
jgi:hypothetical protein